MILVVELEAKGSRSLKSLLYTMRATTAGSVILCYVNLAGKHSLVLLDMLLSHAHRKKLRASVSVFYRFQQNGIRFFGRSALSIPMRVFSQKPIMPFQVA